MQSEQDHPRSDDDLAIVIDLGTGGPKVGFATLRGRVLWSEHYLVDTTFTPDGGAEQDAEQWWRLVCEGVRAGLASGMVEAADIRAVSVTGQWASTVPVDDAGHPVGPCVVWMDTRGGEATRRLVGGPASGYHPTKLLTYIRHSGGAPSLDGADPTGARLFLREQRPDEWDRARWLLEPVDYLSMRFTGVAAATAASMTASWLCDTRNPAVVTYDPELLALAGIDDTKLPPLRPFPSVVAEVSETVAAELGLPPSVRVVTGSPDLHSAAVGAGAIGDYEANMAISTTSWLSCPTPKKKTDVFRQVASVPGLRPDRYLVADNHDTAGLCLSWLRTVLAEASSPGAGGVVFTPWLKGIRTPVADGRARAGFSNISLETTRADLVRATLEGVAYHNRWLLVSVEKFLGRRLDPIRIIGGGAVSDTWCQIHADVLDRTIEQVADPLYCGLRGAALLAGLALGEIAEAEVRDLVPIRSVYRPNPARRAVYDRLAPELAKIYKANKGLFHRLND
jgi:xylulokinase